MKKPTKQPCKVLLKPQERYRLMAETAISMTAILRWERGESIRPSTRLALERGARHLKLPVPEKQVGA